MRIHVVGPGKVPMARVLGEPAGRFIQQLHESQDVRFHLGNSVKEVSGRRIALSDGAILDADFLVVGEYARARREVRRRPLLLESGVRRDREPATGKVSSLS